MNDKLITRLVYGISVFVFIVVVILNRKIIPVTIETPGFVYYLPALNAMINGLCSLLLIVSLYQIKRKNIELHKKIMLLAKYLKCMNKCPRPHSQRCWST